MNLFRGYLSSLIQFGEVQLLSTSLTAHRAVHFVPGQVQINEAMFTNRRGK